MAPLFSVCLNGVCCTLAREKKEMKQDKEYELLKEQLKKRFINTAHMMWGRDINELTQQEIYQTVAATAKQYISENWIKTNRAYMEHGDKQIYYFSIEFLLGRLLKSNLLNLGIQDAVEDVLKGLKIDMSETYQEEPDAGLGNGGLGRLAACFIDSMASHSLPGHGCSIRYQYGLFEQKIVEGNQVELPDNWLKNGFAWEYRKPDKSVDVKFEGNAYMAKQEDGSLKLVYENPLTVMAVPYDVPIVGYHNHTVNTLRLWNAEVNRDFTDYGSMTQEQMKKKHDYREFVENITKFLYPDDSTYEGRRLRLIQEYFFVSAGVQSIVRHYKKTGLNIHDFAKKIGIHINDTHPALCVAELMRILVDEEGLEWDEAWSITKNTIAYTNHTIMPEALEKWPVDMFRPLLPRIYMIIDEINRRWLIDVRNRYPKNEDKVHQLSIIQDGMVHMARLSIVGSHSVNGVAKIHTSILKSTTLHPFYEYNPHMFNNKTNGITHRRWLIGANPELAELINSKIGRRWHRHPEQLDMLNDYVDDKPFLEELGKIKHIRKQALANYIKEHNHLEVNPDTIFDIQVKRIHSYKRQLMNILHIMYQYHRLKTEPDYTIPPTTYFFGGKAAPGYYIAKETIRLINAVADKINHDKDVADKLRVVFIENFGVSIGEIVYPAADIHEQISTASKEAAGTGNMKFMMNGAIMLGTLDGANIEIRDAIGGDDNCVIFGLKAADVLNYYATGTYSAWDEYNTNKNVRFVVDRLTDGTYGDFHSLKDYLIHDNDEFFIMKDFNSYAYAHEEMYRRYQDREHWLHSCAMNIANSGIFSSDRTIDEYANEIWQIKPVYIG
jgi:starch phosphorylase